MRRGRSAAWASSQGAPNTEQGTIMYGRPDDCARDTFRINEARFQTTQAIAKENKAIIETEAIVFVVAFVRREVKDTNDEFCEENTHGSFCPLRITIS